MASFWDEKINRYLTEMEKRYSTCPFCGGKIKIEDSGHDDGSVSIRCTSCGLLGGHYDDGDQAKYVMSSRAENSDFLPCPLCGNPPIIFSEGSKGAMAQCNNCYIDMTSFVSREDLREMWNNRKGTSKHGKYKRTNKLNNEQAENARSMVSTGVPIARVARKFGVSRQTMYKVINKTGGYREDEENR